MAGELVEVHGTYWTADNLPERGTVTFTPVLSAPMSGDPSRVVSQGKVTADLDGDGSFTVELLASDDPGWQTDGPVPYRVVERLSCQVRSYLVIVPTNPSGTDITVLQPPSNSDVVVLPVLGPPGPPGDDGAPGEPGAPGAPGAPGPPGLGIQILSAVPTVADLPTTGQPGDAHLVIESGDLYVWGTDGAWHDSGHVQGPPGPAGPLDILTDVDVSAAVAGTILTKMPNGTWMGRPNAISNLNSLSDVSAPASTPTNRLLGTTAVGSWEPVPNPVPPIGPSEAGKVLTAQGTTAVWQAPQVTTPDPWGYYREDYPQWTPEQSWSKGDICFNDGQYWVIWYDAPSQVDDPLIEEPTVANNGGNSWFSVDLLYLAYEMVRGGLNALDAGWGLNAAVGGSMSTPPEQWTATAYQAGKAVRHQPVEFGPYYLYVALENTGPTDVPGESPKWRLAYITDGTLGGLTDVTAPANTPPHMGLGTTAVGQWGPVAFTPLNPEPVLVEPWSASTKYFPGNVVIGADGYHYTSDIVQSGGTAPSLTNYATWTVLAGYWNGVRSQQAISQITAILGTPGMASWWEPRTYTVGDLVAYMRPDGRWGLWVAAQPVVAGDVPGVSPKWDRFDLTGVNDLIHDGISLSWLADVDDSAGTAPVGKVLGTTATGQWGPVDPPSGGGGGPEQWWADQVQGLLTATTGWGDPYPQYDAATDYARNAIVGRAGMYYYASADPTVGVAPPAAPWVPLNLLRIVQSKGLANGYAGLDSHGKVPDSELAHPIWTGTQAAYDALAVKDPATIYMITG